MALLKPLEDRRRHCKRGGGAKHRPASRPSVHSRMQADTWPARGLILGCMHLEARPSDGPMVGERAPSACSSQEGPGGPVRRIKRVLLQPSRDISGLRGLDWIALDPEACETHAALHREVAWLQLPCHLCGSTQHSEGICNGCMWHRTDTRVAYSLHTLHGLLKPNFGLTHPRVCVCTRVRARGCICVYAPT